MRLGIAAAAAFAAAAVVPLAGCDQVRTAASNAPAAGDNGMAGADEAMRDANAATAAADAASRPAPPDVGRYAIVHSPQVERDTMLLDTATGRTWQLVRDGDDDNAPLSWQEVRRDAP